MIDSGSMVEFIGEISALRVMFPELSKEIDKCLFDVLNNHTPKCGHGNCACQTTTFEQFHYERNLEFQTLSEAEHYEFN